MEPHKDGRTEEKMKNKSSNKKLILGLIALVALIGVFAVVYNAFRPKPTEGSKSPSTL